MAGEGQKTSGSFSQGARIGVKSVKTGVKTARKAKNSSAGLKLFGVMKNSPIFWIIALICFVCIVGVGAISSTQGNASSHIQPSVDPIPEDREMRLIDQTSKSVVTEREDEMMAVINEFIDDDYNNKMSEISKVCSQNGLNYEDTIAALVTDDSDNVTETYEGPTDNTSDSQEGSNSILQTWTLSSEKGGDRSVFTMTGADKIPWAAGTKQYELYKEDKKLYYDDVGFARYMAGDSKDKTKDYYIVALGSRFGSTIYNKYKITFKKTDGSTIELICILGDGKADKHTDSTNSYTTSSGCWCEFEVKSSMTKYGNAALIPNSPIPKGAKIEKIELIDGEFVNNISSSSTMQGYRLLTAFSVSIDNLQIIKKPIYEYPMTPSHGSLGVTKKVLTGYKYVDNKGNEVDLETNWLDDEPNFEKTIKKKLEKYISSGGSFYELSWEKTATGEIKKYEKKYSLNSQESSGETNSSASNLVDIAATTTYAKPIIKAKNIDDIAEEVFDLDPDAKYINGGGYTTNREAITDITENTLAIFHDEKSSTDGGSYDVDLTGEWVWPAPNYAYISSGFGYRVHPISGQVAGHTGVDMASSQGNPILASKAGTVIYSGWYSGYGYAVIINHGNGVKTLYGHCSKLLVKKGQKVNKGQQIAKVGSTGNSTGPHLHFEVLVNEIPKDPMNIIKKPN